MHADTNEGDGGGRTQTVLGAGILGIAVVGIAFASLGLDFPIAGQIAAAAVSMLLAARFGDGGSGFMGDGGSAG